MTIAFGTSGTAATGSTSLSVPYPASIAAGDLLVLVICNKYPTNGPSTPAGWTAPTNNQQSGGSGSAGIDVGSVYCTVYVKIALGTESGNLSVTITSGNSAVGRMFRYTKASAKNWEWSLANGSDNSAGTSWSVTAGSDPGIAGGDVVVVGSAVNTDAYTFSAEAISATGVTFGTATERQDSGTTTGQDCKLVVSDHLVSSGTSSAAPVYTMTSSGTATNNPAGASVIVRLREVDLFIDPGGIGTAEAFGTPVEQQNADPGGIGTGEAFGTPSGAFFVDGTGIASEEAIGALTLANNLDPGGIGTAEALGDPFLDLVLGPAGIDSAESFGASVWEMALSASSVASGEAFGDGVVTLIVSPTGVSTGELVGLPTVDVASGVLNIDPSGISGGEAFGTALLGQITTASGVSSSESFGTTVVQANLDASGIGTGEAFGTGSFETVIDALEAAPSEAFGASSLHQTIDALGAATSEAFGTAVFGQFLSAGGVGSSEAFGTAVFGEVKFVDPSSIASGIAFGSALLVFDLFPAGVGSGEAFGAARVELIAPDFNPGAIIRVVPVEPLAVVRSFGYYAFIFDEEQMARVVEGVLGSVISEDKARVRVSPRMFTIKKGDTAPSYTATLQTKVDGDYVPMDLSGAVVQFIMGLAGQPPIVESPAVVVDPVGGVVRYDWGPTDTATVGNYRAVFQVTFSGGAVQSCPTNEFLQVRVVENLG